MTTNAPDFSSSSLKAAIGSSISAIAPTTIEPKKTGRPRTIDRQKLLAQFEEYIATTTIPIIAEFCARYGVYRQRLYDFEEFSEAIKIAITKKEGALERGCLEGTLTPSMAIFSLKQLGWKDVIEQKGTQAWTLTIGATDKKL